MSELLYSRIEGEGKPLLILHGFLGMSDNWKTLSGRFAQEGYQVHALDLRNHGRSFHSDEFTHQAMMQDVLHYCQYHNLTSVNVIGHSMGGKLAMFLAIAHPNLIDKLVIADISVRAYPPHHQDILDALNSIDFSILKERKEIEAHMAHYIHDFGTLQFLMKNVYRKSQNELAFRMNLKVLTENYDNMGVEVSNDKIYDKPTLFLKGENSNYIRERDVEDILQIFPKAIIESIPNAGHWLHAENPDLFYSFVIQYFNS